MKENPAVECRRFIVRGKVQGVFFRASTRNVARELGVTGHAINLPDGSVEVVACGDSDALEGMRRFLRAGPARSRVDSVDETGLTIAVPDRFRTG